MKRTFKIIAGAGLTAIAICTMAMNYPWTSTSAVISGQGSTVETTQPTNGLYTAGITQATIETNLVLLSSGRSGNVLTVSIAGQMNDATATNITVVLSQAPAPVAITNSTATANIGAACSSSPRKTYYTAVLTTAGTTPVLTNVTFTPSTTPPMNGACSYYVESIGVGTGAASTSMLTNFTVTATAN